jgi:hypothetical protein
MAINNFMVKICICIIIALAYGSYRVEAKEQLRIEDLGSIIEAATLLGQQQITFPQIKQNHLFLYYNILRYWKHPSQLLDINLDTDQARVTDVIPGRGGGGLLHSNGKLYIASGDPGYFMVYDVQSGQGRQISKLADKNAHYVIEGDDGAIYIGEDVKGIVERYDPKDGTWENYGIMDDPGPPYYRYVYTLGADGRYIYAGMGQRPWYLVIYDRVLKKQRVYWKNDHLLSLQILRGVGIGWYVDIVTSQGQHRAYKLNGDQAPQLLLVNPQVVSPNAPRQTNTFHFAPKYEFDLGQATPNSGNGGQVTVRWRKSGSSEWQQASAQVRIGPYDIKQLYKTPEGNFFGFTPFYGPVFTYDPITRQQKILGYPQRSLYDALFAEGEWFFAGYPAAFMRFDPSRPWNLNSSTKNFFDKNLNPRLVKIDAYAKYYHHLVQGADGYIYIGGHQERNAVGGSLGWFHPKTGLSGNLREPFLEQDVNDLISIEDGAKIVFSGLAIKSGAPGKLFIFDAHKKALLNSFAPISGSRSAGTLIEVREGIVLGVIPRKPKTIIYQADMHRGVVLWEKEIDGTAFGGVRPSDHRLIKGPDGHVWLYIDNTICKLNPSDGNYERIIEAPPTGNLLWFKNDLYIYGGETLRRVSGLLEIHPK